MIPKLSRNLSLAAVLVVASLVFLVGLGRNTLANWDEAWYADASRHMYRAGHYLTPIWNNQYFFDKPPLQYWLTQPFLWWFGEIELVYRLPSALASIGLVSLVFLWGRRRGGIAVGLISAAILLTFPHFIDRGRSGNFDGLLILLTTLSLYLYQLKKVILAGLVLGLAWLTKGVFSGFFPIMVTALFSAYDSWRQRRLSPGKAAWLYFLAAAAVYVPWHLLEFSRFEELIEKSYFATFDQGEFGGWSWMDIVWRFNLRYLVFLWTFLRMWFPILLISLWWQVMRLDKDIHRPDQAKAPLLAVHLPLVVFTVIFLALSAAWAKNDWYIMPAYPFIALMISDLFHHIFKKQKLVMILIVLSISISNLYLYRHQAFPRDNHMPEKQVAASIAEITSPDDLIVTAEYEFPTLIYYSQREVRTAARQRDYDGKYWWVWDNVDIATALRRGRRIVTIHRPGTEWQIDVAGWRREKIAEINDRIISRLIYAD